MNTNVNVQKNLINNKKLCLFEFYGFYCSYERLYIMNLKLINFKNFMNFDKGT